MIDHENVTKIKKAVGSIIEAIGDDSEREGLLETPRRIAQMYQEFFSGLDQDPSEVLSTGFEEDHREIVVLTNIPFFSICEHHFLPFFGSASIGYVPSGRVVGASKLVRALDILARRPQIQERLTKQLADTIFTATDPEGVVVMLTAEHMCMALRGVKKLGGKIATSAARGSVKMQDSIRRDMYALLGKD